MSKSSQRKISMEQLGKKDFKYLFPSYPKSKEYMKGYNSMKPRSLKMKTKTSLIMMIVIITTVIVLQLIFGEIK